jgi:hypothetical protein
MHIARPGSLSALSLSVFVPKFRNLGKFLISLWMEATEDEEEEIIISQMELSHRVDELHHISG